MRRAGHTLLLGFACLCCLGPLAGAAGAAPSVESSSLSLSTTQAGAHADLTLSVALEEPGEPETARGLRLGLPPGYFPYPAFQVRCSDTQIADRECPVDSQVGVAGVSGNFGGDPEFELGTGPVYMLAPEDDKVVRLGLVLPPFESVVKASATAAPGNGYGLELALGNLPEDPPLQSLDLTLWGIPADEIHDEERFPLIPGGRPSGQPLIPFIRNPTSCGPGGILTVEVDSYEDPGDLATATGSTPSIAGCGKLAFDPAFDAELTSTEAGVPVGIELTAKLPGDLTPNGLSTSDAEEVFVSLPPQLALDEDALAGQASCLSSQARLDGSGAGECPPGSKIGTFDGAVLGAEAPFEGSVYFGGAVSPDTYAIFLLAAAGGVDLRLLGLLEYDEATGSWAVDLPELPQLPFEELELKLAGAAGPFIARGCGSFPASSELAPWSGSSPLLATRVLTISSGPAGGPCPVPAQNTVAPPASPRSPTGTPPAPPLPKPVVEFRRRPAARTRDRTPSFRFVSTVAPSSFDCRIDRRPLRPCKSPLTLPRLGLGRHTFKVRATTPGGVASRFASYGFVIRR
jgi:hypothetical protein